MAVIYTFTERMAFELGLQTAKTAIELSEALTPLQKVHLKLVVEDRANKQCPEMRVIEPARKPLNNN